MVPPVAFVFIRFGLVCVFRPNWFVAIDREVKTFGTNTQPDEIEFAGWWVPSIQLVGVFSILFGTLITFDVI